MHYTLKLCFILGSIQTNTIVSMESVSSPESSWGASWGSSVGEVKFIGLSPENPSPPFLSPDFSDPLYAGLRSFVPKEVSPSSFEGVYGNESFAYINETLSGNLRPLEPAKEMKHDTSDTAFLSEFVLIPDNQSALQQLRQLATHSQVQENGCNAAIQEAASFLLRRVNSLAEVLAQKYDTSLLEAKEHLSITLETLQREGDVAENISVDELVKTMQVLVEKILLNTGIENHHTLTKKDKRMTVPRIIANSFLEILKKCCPLTNLVLLDPEIASHGLTAVAEERSNVAPSILIEIAQFVMTIDRQFPYLLDLENLSVTNLKATPFLTYFLEHRASRPQEAAEKIANNTLNLMLKELAQKTVLLIFYSQEPKAIPKRKKNKGKEYNKYSDSAEGRTATRRKALESDIHELIRQIEGRLDDKGLNVEDLFVYMNHPCQAQIIYFIKIIFENQLRSIIDYLELNNYSKNTASNSFRKLLKIASDLNRLFSQKTNWAEGDQTYFTETKIRAVQAIIMMFSEDPSLQEVLMEHVPTILEIEDLHHSSILCSIAEDSLSGRPWNLELWNMLMRKALACQASLVDAGLKDFLAEIHLHIKSDPHLTSEKLSTLQKAFQKNTLETMKKLDSELQRASAAILRLASQEPQLVDDTVLQVKNLRNVPWLLFLIVKKIMATPTERVSREAVHAVLKQLLIVGDTLRSTATNQEEYTLQRIDDERLEENSKAMVQAHRQVVILQEALKKRESKNDARNRALIEVFKDKVSLKSYYEETVKTFVELDETNPKIITIGIGLRMCGYNFKKLVLYANTKYNKEDGVETKALAYLFWRSLTKKVVNLRERLKNMKDYCIALEKENDFYLKSQSHAIKMHESRCQTLEDIGCALLALESKFSRLISPSILEAYPKPSLAKGNQFLTK